jgi:hypothetical protein
MQTFRQWIESSLSHPAQVAFNSVFEAAVAIRKFMNNLKGKQQVPQQDVYGIADAAQKLYSAIINMDSTTRGEIETGQHTDALSNRVYYAMKDIDMIVSDMKDNPERYGDMATSAVSRLGGNGYSQTVRTAGTAGNNHLQDMYKELVGLRQKIRSAYDNMFKD